MTDTTTIARARRRGLRHHGRPRHPAIASAKRCRPRRARCSSCTRRRSPRRPRSCASSSMADGDREVLLAEIPDAEQGKRIEVAAFCWQVMGKADFTRTDAVVGFGGGAVTDLAGFVAATWLRGVAGRPGARRRCSAWWMPRSAARPGSTPRRARTSSARSGRRARSCATSSLLDSLSRTSASPGFAEVVKAGFIWYPEILDLIEADPEAAVDPPPPRSGAASSSRSR